MKSNDVCTIYLVRHGKTEWNMLGRIQGHTDIPLLPEGEEQARELALKLKDVHFDAAYSSDLSRAKQTATIIVSNRNMEVVTTPRLRERNWSSWEGKMVSELRKQHGPLFHQFLELREDHEMIAHPDIPAIETYKQTANRVIPMLLETSQLHMGKKLLVVSHYGVLKSILLQLKNPELMNPIIDNLGYFRIETDGSSMVFKEAYGIRQG